MAQDHLDDLAGVGLIHMEIDAEGLLGQAFGFQDGGFHLVRLDGCTGEKAETTSITGRRHQLRISNPTHGSLDDRVAAAQQFGQSGIERDTHAYASPCLRWELAMALAS
ncbi:hypothetical protein D9M73_263130 [compost metagenome]